MAESLKDRIKKTQFKEVTINDVTFTLKKCDALEIQRILIKSKGTTDDLEIPLILNAIKDYKGIKTSDLVESEEGFTAKELDELVPFDREYLEMYLGKNQQVLIDLYQIIVKDFIDYTAEKEKKSQSSDTKSKK